MISKNFLTLRRVNFRQLSSVSQELISLSKKDVNSDVLLNNLKQAGNTENILQLVKAHGTIMNNRHLMQALRSIFNLQKFGNSKFSMAQLLQHPDFENLCRKLKHQAGAIELNDTIEALKVVNFVGVASDSTIVTVLLQLLRHQINQLSLHQIFFFDFLLTQMRPTPLAEALQIALPIVFEINMPIKIDTGNVVQLVESLQYASRKNVSKNCIEFLVSGLLRYNGTFTGKQACSIVWSLCDLRPDIFFDSLIKRAIKSVVADVESLSFNDLETIVGKLSNNYSSKYTFYYDYELCNICTSHIIDNDSGIQSAIYLLRKLLKMSHSENKLLDYICRKIVLEKSLLSDIDLSLQSTFINALSKTNYRPQQWEIVKAILQETDSFHKNVKRDIQWLKLAVSYLLLDIEKPQVIEMALRTNYIHKLLSKGHIYDFEQFLLLRQMIVLYWPNYEHLLPNASIVEQIHHRSKRNNDYPLEGALCSAYGGTKYVKTGLITDLHHNIDHAIIMRKGGYPVAFSTSDNSTETINLDEVKTHSDHQIITILALNQSNYTINSKKMKSTTMMTINTLESKGYLVVPINTQDWLELADFEKIPYLVQTIANKLDVCKEETAI